MRRWAGARLRLRLRRLRQRRKEMDFRRLQVAPWCSRAVATFRTSREITSRTLIGMGRRMLVLESVEIGRRVRIEAEIVAGAGVLAGVVVVADAGAGDGLEAVEAAGGMAAGAVDGTRTPTLIAESTADFGR